MAPPSTSMKPTGVRPASQDRSVKRQQQIAEAAIATIAEHGITGVTHRRIARKANVSLAATTYYYGTKHDIVADASRHLLESYVTVFERTIEGFRQGTPPRFSDFALELVANAISKKREGALAWCEIMLSAARHPDMVELARDWFSRFADVWTGIAEVMKLERTQEAARPASDIIIGLVFTVLALGVSETAIYDVIRDGKDVRQAWNPQDEAQLSTIAKPAEPSGRKAEQTRQDLLSAAIAILTAEGASGVTYRAVAAKAGLTAAAPTYHFPTIASLLATAQEKLFNQAKDRYHFVMTEGDFDAFTIDSLTDLTTTVFVREATEFGPASMACYPIWLEAARHPELRPAIWAGVDDQYLAWQRSLARLTDNQRPQDALILQALFVGKLIRILATGCDMADLAKVRGEFANDIRDIISQSYWPL